MAPLPAVAAGRADGQAVDPGPSRAALTASTRSGRTIAVTSFMTTPCRTLGAVRAGAELGGRGPGAGRRVGLGRISPGMRVTGVEAAADHEEFIRRFGVLRHVNAGELVGLGNAHADALVDREADQRGHGGAPCRDDQGGENLRPELRQAAAVEQAAGRLGGRKREESEGQGPPQAADEVHGHDVQGVVEPDLELQPDGERADGPGDHTDQDGADGVDESAGRGDRRVPRDGSRGGAERGGMPVAQPLRRAASPAGRRWWRAACWSRPGRPWRRRRVPNRR